jgi:hypothetical protein
MRLTVLFFLLLSSSAQAHQPTLNECLEGAEFIGNAALLRDSGRPEGEREVFVGRAIAELEMIQQFPPELRWFAQDEEDEKFLLDEIVRVWDQPQDPQDHYRQFFDRCVQR